MNNLIGIILGLTDDNPEWKYINRKGNVITCTKVQFQSYFKKRKVDHNKIMKEAIDVLFSPCPLYFKLTK